MPRHRLTLLLCLACAPSPDEYTEEDFLADYTRGICRGAEVCGEPPEGAQSYDDCRWSVRNGAEWLIAQRKAQGGRFDPDGAWACAQDALARAEGDCARDVVCWGDGQAMSEGEGPH